MLRPKRRDASPIVAVRRAVEPCSCGRPLSSVAGRHTVRAIRKGIALDESANVRAIEARASGAGRKRVPNPQTTFGQERPSSRNLRAAPDVEVFFDFAVAMSSLFPPSSRFSVGERRATLVGRAAELRELELALASAAEKKRAYSVTIIGATGIGKTRLVRDFLVRAREAGHAPRVFRGTAREGGPAYEVFARVLRARFGIVEGMDASAANAQVRAQLATVLEDRKVGDVAYFLGQLLDLDFQRSPLIKAVESDPLHVRSMRRAVIKSFLETDATKDEGLPVLVFDDLQWAHDDSLELLAYLIDSLRAPVLLVCMARPEMHVRRDDWQGHGGDRHKLIELSPLGEVDAAAVMHDLLSPCGDDQEVDRLVDEAVSLAGGNPALLEQIVRVYLETGVLESTDQFEDEHWEAHPERLDRVQLPLTVEDAVQTYFLRQISQDRRRTAITNPLRRRSSAAQSR